MQGHKGDGRTGAASTVDRPRLTALVEATEPGAVCQVVAAPGYGATTLLRQVADAAHSPVVHLRCRPGESLAAAFARAQGGRYGPAPGGPDGMLEALHREPPSWLIVDVAGDVPYGFQGIHDDLVQLANELPPACRLLIASRVAPDWSPAIASRLVELDEDHLALNREEASSLLPGLEMDELEGVCRTSGGWASALRALATRQGSLRGRATDWLTGPGAQRLLNGWFESLPQEQRAFLIDTAVLDELTVGACDATIAATGSASVLDELVRHHRFVREETDAGERTWERQPLLTAFLRHREDLDHDRSVRHSRAADWYVLTSNVSAAMHHLIASGRADDAAAYLVQHEASLFMSGTGAQAADWYERIADTRAGGDRTMRLLRIAWAKVLSGEIDESAVWLTRLRAAQAQPEMFGIESDRRLEGELCVLEAYLAAFRGDAVTMAEAGQRAVQAFDGLVDRDAGQQAYVLWIKGLQWCGQHARAARVLDSLTGTVFPNDMVRESSLAGLHVQRLRHEGRIHEAYAVAARADRWLDSCGGDPAGERQLRGRGEWAATVLERGDIDNARPVLLAAAEACHEHGRYAERALLLVSLARLHRVTGRLDRAVAALAEARALLIEHAPNTPLLYDIDLASAAVRMDLRDLSGAEQLIRKLPLGDERRLVGARALVLHGADPRRALSETAVRTPRTIAVTHLLCADASLRQGRLVAEEHLFRAADTALATGQALLLLDAGPALKRLAAELVQRDRHEGLAFLLQAVGLHQASPASAIGGPLSPGELELIPLLTGRATIADLAEVLGISRNTMKTRLQRLYRKLGVDSRDEVIAVARQRGLL